MPDFYMAREGINNVYATAIASRLGLLHVGTLWNMTERGYKVAQRE